MFILLNNFSIFLRTHFIFKERNEIFANLNIKSRFFRKKQGNFPEILNFPQNLDYLLKNAEFGKARNSLERLL